MATGEVRSKIELLNMFKDNVNQNIYPIDLRDFVTTMFYNIGQTSNVSSYTYIAYSDDLMGTNFTSSFDINKKFISIITTSSPLDPNDPSNYSGNWVRYIGEKGEDGKSFLSGNVAPGNLVGDIGDIYININSNMLYGPKDVNGWGSGVSIKGSGIDTIAKTNTSGNIDTYTITFDDSSTTTFQITNGAIQIGNNISNTGGKIYKENDSSNRLVFRNISTNTPNNIKIDDSVLSDNFIYVDFNYNYIKLNLTFISKFIINNLKAVSLFNDKFIKFSGYAKYNDPVGVHNAGVVFFRFNSSFNIDSYFQCYLHKLGSNTVENILMKTSGSSPLISVSPVNSFTVESGDFLSFEGVNFIDQSII